MARREQELGTFRNHFHCHKARAAPGAGDILVAPLDIHISC